MNDRELSVVSLRWRKSGQAVALVAAGLAVACLIARWRGEAAWAEMFFLLAIGCWAGERAVLNLIGPQRFLALHTLTGLLVLISAVLGIVAGVIALGVAGAMLAGQVTEPPALLSVVIVGPFLVNTLVSLAMMSEARATRQR